MKTDLHKMTIATLAAVCLGLLPLPGQAEELPAFSRGLWEFNRTMDMGGG